LGWLLALVLVSDRSVLVLEWGLLPAVVVGLEAGEVVLVEVLLVSDQSVLVLEQRLLPVVGVILEAGEVLVVEVTELSSTGTTAATVYDSSSSSALDCWNERVVLVSIDADNSVAEKILRCTRDDTGEEDGCTRSIVVL